MVLATGCAYVPPDMMPPEPQARDFQPPSPFVRAAVDLAPASGVHTSFWQRVNGDEMVQIPTIQQALLRSLQHSGIFASVSEGSDAPYELRAEILAQDKVADQVIFLVRYVLRDSRAGREVLAQEIETSSRTSEDTAPGASLIAGNAALSRAAFRAAGKNISLLLVRLRSVAAP